MSASIQFIGQEAPTMKFLCRVCGRREGEPPRMAPRNWDGKAGHQYQ